MTIGVAADDGAQYDEEETQQAWRFADARPDPRRAAHHLHQSRVGGETEWKAGEGRGKTEHARARRDALGDLSWREPDGLEDGEIAEPLANAEERRGHEVDETDQEQEQRDGEKRGTEGVEAADVRGHDVDARSAPQPGPQHGTHGLLVLRVVQSHEVHAGGHPGLGLPQIVHRDESDLAGILRLGVLIVIPARRVADWMRTESPLRGAAAAADVEDTSGIW
jgi:hypothetical protein